MKKIRFDTANLAIFAAFILGLVLFLSVIRAVVSCSVADDKRLWFEITFLILAAIVAEILVEYLKQPSVIGLLIVGAFLSQSFLDLAWPLIAKFLDALSFGLLSPPSAIHLASAGGAIAVFAQIGAIFLLFEAGMQAKIDEIFNRKNFFIALFGVAAPFACGYAYSALSGSAASTAMFVGAALTATSVGVTVSVLAELGALNRPFAKAIIRAAVIDDVLALLVLSAVPGLGFGGVEADHIFWLLAVSAVFICGGLAVGLWAVNRFSERGGGKPQRRFLLSLAAIFFYSYAAEFIGLSSVIGAFVAGLVLSQSAHSQEILAKAAPLQALFTPIFFLSLGMFIDVNTVLSALPSIVLLSLVAFASKLVGCGIAARATGSSPAESLSIGLGMVPRGEIALIIALLGLQSGALSATDYSVISAMSFATTIIPPFLLSKLLK